jgi:hypothetical protein
VWPYSNIKNDIYSYESSGIFKQTQLITNVNTRVNSHVSVQGFYVYGQAHSNAQGLPMDNYDARYDWGRAQFDVRHRAFIGGNIGLPFALVLAPFVTMSSGTPFNITTGNPFYGDGILNERPAFAPAGATPNGKNIINPTINGKSYLLNITPVLGDPYIPVNYGDGPNQFSVNFRLSRSWGWGERNTGGNPNQFGGPGGPGGPDGGGRGGFGGGRRGGGGGFGGGFGGGPRGMGGFGNVGGTGKKYNLTATISARNAFNHVNLGQPNGVITSPFFGESTSLAGGGFGGGPGGGGGFGGSGSAAGNRRIELQLRFTF